ncbi:hypothetical protein [Janthinobacterium sp.]|uniref:hypothetical protein n=1 Tax=Janthinobacterium sp. TaxID=1871054 RepID=UPI0026196551|nr:hypothetical protein [Janthinobacterium sp.]
MSGKIDIGQNKDHIGGNFEWEVEPNCKCGNLIHAVEEQFIFVGNFLIDGFNNFYMMPVAANGYPIRDNGVAITHCPWCGEKIKGKKKYITK